MHHPVGESPRKIILEELPTLVHHQPMADPAHARGDAGNEIAVSQMQVEIDQGRADYSDRDQKRCEHRPTFQPGRPPVRLPDESHHLADEHGYQRVRARDSEAADEQPHEDLLMLREKVSVKRE